MTRALAPAMAKPARNASSEAILSSERVFFTTTKTSAARRILQPERNATLLVEVLRSNVAARKFQLHDFVIMPDHLHLLMELPSDISIERAMQLVKGGFSYRLRKEHGFRGEVWQRGFTDHRIRDAEDFVHHRNYIHRNPSSGTWWRSPRTIVFARRSRDSGWIRGPQRLKPRLLQRWKGTSKLVPFPTKVALIP